MLRTGTNLIRILLVGGIVFSLLGIVFSLVQTGFERMTLLAALFFLNSVVMTAVLLIMVSRKLPARIRQMALVMNSAAEGKLTERVNLEGETEISQLADNFNSMMERLSGAISKVHYSLQKRCRRGLEGGRCNNSRYQ